MRAAVLGSPVGHSLSPLLHRAAYAALGLDWSYQAIEVAESGLRAFLDGLDATWAGLSLTMPLKSAVIPLLDEVAPEATTVGAVNTVLLGHGRRRGHNTDIQGVTAALTEAAGPAEGGAGPGLRAAVLGSGATARSALAALAGLGHRQVRVAARSLPPATSAAGSALGLALEPVPLEPASLRGVELLVSALPPGVADGLAPHQDDVRVLLDAVYAPWPTELARGCPGRVAGGHDLLLHQAAAQVTLMTGLAAPLAAMRAALKGSVPRADGR